MDFTLTPEQAYGQRIEGVGVHRRGEAGDADEHQGARDLHARALRGEEFPAQRWRQKQQHQEKVQDVAGPHQHRYGVARAKVFCRGVEQGEEHQRQRLEQRLVKIAHAVKFQRHGMSLVSQPTEDDRRQITAVERHARRRRQARRLRTGVGRRHGGVQPPPTACTISTRSPGVRRQRSNVLRGTRVPLISTASRRPLRCRCASNAATVRSSDTSSVSPLR